MPKTLFVLQKDYLTIIETLSEAEYFRLIGMFTDCSSLDYVPCGDLLVTLVFVQTRRKTVTADGVRDFMNYLLTTFVTFVNYSVLSPESSVSNRNPA